MKRPAKIAFSLALILVLVLSLSACGSKTPQQVLTEAGEKLSKTSSARYNFTMDLSMSADEDELDMSLGGSGAFTRDPEVTYLKMTMGLGELGDMDVETYVQAGQSAYDLYAGVSLGGETYWQYQQADEADLDGQINAEEALSIYLDTGSSFQAAGTETVLEQTAVRYDGVVAKESIQQVLEATGMDSSMEQMLNLPESVFDLEVLQDSLADVPISIWVDQESGLPVQYEMDMTELMRAIMEQALEGTDTEVRVEAIRMTATFYDFDQVESIPIPEEALKAKS